jgi:F-type H+-transporting ATPase subunit a
MAAISLQSAKIIEVGSFYLTSAALASLAVTLFLIFLAWRLRKTAGIVPTRLQSFFEVIASPFQEMLLTAYSSEKRARKYLPFYLTLVLFILVANQFSVIPLVNSILAGEATLFKTATSDFSQTVALALVSIAAAHIIAFTTSPLRHIGNFIKVKPFFKVRNFADFGNACLDFFLGLLDIIGELAKVVSLSARLFGNVFAGEVMVVVIAGISFYTQFLIPVPFLVLSIFSGLVQAYVFASLSLQFMALTINSVADEENPTQELSAKPSAL